MDKPGDDLGPHCFKVVIRNDPNNQNQFIPGYWVFDFELLKELKHSIINNTAQVPFLIFSILRKHHLSPHHFTYACSSSSQYNYFNMQLQEWETEQVGSSR